MNYHMETERPRLKCEVWNQIHDNGSKEDAHLCLFHLWEDRYDFYSSWPTGRLYLKDRHWCLIKWCLFKTRPLWYTNRKRSHKFWFEKNPDWVIWLELALLHGYNFFFSFHCQHCFYPQMIISIIWFAKCGWGIFLGPQPSIGRWTDRCMDRQSTWSHRLLTLLLHVSQKCLCFSASKRSDISYRSTKSNVAFGNVEVALPVERLLNVWDCHRMAPIATR